MTDVRRNRHRQGVKVRETPSLSISISVSDRDRFVTNSVGVTVCPWAVRTGDVTTRSTGVSGVNSTSGVGWFYVDPTKPLPIIQVGGDVLCVVIFSPTGVTSPSSSLPGQGRTTETPTPGPRRPETSRTSQTSRPYEPGLLTKTPTVSCTGRRRLVTVGGQRPGPVTGHTTSFRFTSVTVTTSTTKTSSHEPTLFVSSLGV